MQVSNQLGQEMPLVAQKKLHITVSNRNKGSRLVSSANECKRDRLSLTIPATPLLIRYSGTLIAPFVISDEIVPNETAGARQAKYRNNTAGITSRLFLNPSAQSDKYHLLLRTTSFLKQSELKSNQL